MTFTDKMILTLALDAMGGDAAPEMVIEGAALAGARHDDIRFVLFGDETRLKPLITPYGALKDRCEIRHTSEVVGADDKPSQTVRRGKGTSMWKAIEMVKNGEAGVAISAGNTGVLMAMSVLQLRTMKDIRRPAIASTWPGPEREKVVLDLGANLECDEDSLVQFSVMGTAFARVVLNIPKPRLGLLNVGEEEQKGHEYVRAAATLLRQAAQENMEFIGFVEGTDLGGGSVDVVVTDGFTGNVALKTGEGSAKLIFHLLGNAFRSSLLSRLAYVLARRAFQSLRDKLDPRAHNGGVFLGLNGLVIKSHGGTDGVGFAHAIETGIEMAKGDLVSRIAQDMKNFEEALKITIESESGLPMKPNHGLEAKIR